MTIRVFIVDDHELFRSGVRSELGRNLEIVGDAGTVDEAVPAIVELKPDVVLLDVHLPGGGGRAVVDAVRPELPDVKFHRSIGEYAGQRYSIDGELLSDEAYAKHLEDVLPNAADKVRLAEIYKDPEWVLADSTVSPTKK